MNNMVKSNKVKSTDQLEWSRKAQEEFDWSLYEDGYDGTNLVHNKAIKTHDPKDQVYCHEPYAQELYDMIEAHSNGKFQFGGTKDLHTNSVVMAEDIKKISDHEIRIDTVGGSTYVIDMNKEKEFIEAFGGNSAKQFVDTIEENQDFKKQLIDNGVLAKQLKGGRISLWDGHLAKIEDEFMQQLKKPTYAYNATVLETNNGGYMVDIQGIKCFMPGSLAAAGIITDFETLVGKTIPVMIVNYMKNFGFVVSYKKYLSTIMPSKIANELKIGQKIKGKVTGSSKFGVFVQFPDKDGEWVFSGLVHTTGMSKEFAKSFAERKFKNDDEIEVYISEIINDDHKQRIILSDLDPLAKVNELKEKFENEA